MLNYAMEVVTMKYLIILFVPFAAMATYAFGDGFDAPPKAYFEVRVLAEGAGYAPFPIDAWCCDHPIPEPFEYLAHYRYTLFAWEPHAFMDYELFATQMFETDPPNPWELETAHQVFENVHADFNDPYHPYLVFELRPGCVAWPFP
jgi:hypothetical protein